jgi:hypothetical protein
MSFHWTVRAVISRLAAALLVALLATPAIGPSLPDVGHETGAASPQDRGMDAPPGPAASAGAALAPATPAAPPATVARIAWTSAPVLCARLADRVLRSAGAVRPAPAVLRL